MESYYFWKTARAGKLNRSRVKPGQFLASNAQIFDPATGFDSSEIVQINLPQEQGFWATYRSWLVLCAICGPTCAVLFVGAVISQLFWNPGFLLYFVPLALGVFFSIRLPIIWYRRYHLMKKIATL